jgi:hypothetical protein
MGQLVRTAPADFWESFLHAQRAMRRFCAATPELSWPPVPARAENWRGAVGCVKPRVNGALVDV